MCLTWPVPSEPVPTPDAHLFLSNGSQTLSQGQYWTLGLIQLQASRTSPVIHLPDDLYRDTMSSLGSYRALTVSSGSEDHMHSCSCCLAASSFFLRGPSNALCNWRMVLCQTFNLCSSCSPCSHAIVRDPLLSLHSPQWSQFILCSHLLTRSARPHQSVVCLEKDSLVFLGFFSV